MADYPLQVVKTVAALPATLQANTFYLVRVGDGYDLYVTDTTGNAAYKLNVAGSQISGTVVIGNGGTGATTLTAAQTNLGIDKVVSANTRLTAKKAEFPNVFVGGNGQLQKTQLATWLDHAKMYNGLVPNGSFQMGDATGWPNANLWGVGLDYYDYPFGAFGSFVLKQTVNISWPSLPVNPYHRYRHSIMARAIATSPMFAVSLAINYKDIDDNFIDYFNAQHQANTVTTLTQDLKPGDSKVYLSSLANWSYTVGSGGVELGFKFYNYTDSKGYTYNPSVMPYSRYYTNNANNGWWNRDVSSFDTANNAIILKKAWDYSNPKDPSGIWRAGTKIAQIKGTTASVEMVVFPNSWPRTQMNDSPWTYFERVIGGVNVSGTHDPALFPPGTASIHLYSSGLASSGCELKFSNHYLDKI